MPTLTGTLLDGGGSALASTVITFTRLGGAGWSGTSAHSVDTVTATTDVTGAFSRALTGGTWGLRWYTNEGLASSLTIGMPNTGGPYTLDDVAVDPETSQASAAVVWFETLAALLAADARSWTTGRTLNAYADDGIIAGWDRLLKTSPSATGLADNGDSIRETDDELAYAVRTFVVPT